MNRKAVLKSNHGWMIGVMQSVIMEFQRIIARLENEGEVSEQELNAALTVAEIRARYIRQMIEKSNCA